MNFLKSIKSKEAIAVAVRASEGVGKAAASVEKRVKAFWGAAMPELEALPKKRDVFALCGKLTELFTAEFGRARHPVLDEFQTRGAFAQYLSDLKNDFKSVANSAWNAELIPDDEILESQFPEVLEKLRACESRKAELQGMFDAVDELEEDAWNPEEYEVLPKTELKRIKGEIKDAKGGRKEVEKEIKSLEKRVKACRKAKENTAELESEIAGKSAELKPFDERIAALTAQIERHEELAAELRECNADIRAIERRKDDLVTTAREKISPKEAEELILARWYRTLASTISAYVEAHLRSAIAAFENLHDKYTVPLGALLASRTESTAKLDGFLKELGYSFPEVR
jgi:type I restriction enzyme M protein